MDAGAQNEEPTFDEALVMELLSRAAAEAGGQRAAANIKLCLLYTSPSPRD